MAAFQQLIAELPYTLANGDVWLAIGLALLVGGACLLFGIWLTGMLGLLPSDAPAGERLGVGLACGLMVFAAIWAAVWSGGRSSFTPVAVGFALAIALAVVAAVPATHGVSAGAGNGRDGRRRIGLDRDPIRTAQRPRAGSPRRRGVRRGDRAALWIDDGAQPARWRPADGEDRRRVLRRPRQGPGRDRDRDEHLHIGVLGPAGRDGADVVPLGRAVARLRDDRDLRGRAAGGSLPHGPAAAAAGGRARSPARSSAASTAASRDRRSSSGSPSASS